MTKKGLILIFAGLLFGALMGGLILFSNAAPKQGPVIGSKVDDVRLPGLDAESVALSQYRGKIVILNFWATWCVPCKAEMPLLEKIYHSAPEKLVVIGVNSQESKDVVQMFIDENQITFPVALDGSGEIARQFMINGYPTTFFIDQNGILRNLHIGELRENVLVAYLRELGVQ